MSRLTPQQKHSSAMGRTCTPERRPLHRVLMASAVALTAVGIMMTTREAQAQEIQVTGPLKGAPAVRDMRLYRQGRFEIAPSATFTLLDEYRRHVIIGARLNYGITDWLSVGVWGGAGVGFSTDLTTQIDENAQREGLGRSNMPGGDITTTDGGKTVVTGKGSGKFANQVAQIQYVMMGQVTAVPFRGKFSLFQAVFSDVDAYVFLGAGVVGIKERQSCKSIVECATQGGPNRADNPMQGATRFAPTWGLGFNFYLTQFMSFGIEYRMMPFAWNRSGFDSRGQDENGKSADGGRFPDGKINDQDATFQFNQMLGVSLGFSFPTAPKLTD